nr:hypothetical protein [Streptomyces sp. CB00316]
MAYRQPICPRPGLGDAASNSDRRISRRCDPDTQRKRYWLPCEGRYFGLALSANPRVRHSEPVGLGRSSQRAKS